SMNPTPKQLVKTCAAFAACSIAPVALAAVLLLISLSFTEMLAALAGSWKWIADERLTQMYYFKWMMGTDDVGRSIRNMAAWTGVYLALLGISGAIDRAM